MVLSLSLFRFCTDAAAAAACTAESECIARRQLLSPRYSSLSPSRGPRGNAHTSQVGTANYLTLSASIAPPRRQPAAAFGLT